jgi:hypothetical protein
MRERRQHGLHSLAERQRRDLNQAWGNAPGKKRNGARSAEGATQCAAVTFGGETRFQRWEFALIEPWGVAPG